MAKRKILLIDGSSLAFRAFYSILDLNRFKTKSGLHTNALYTFNLMLETVLAQFNPTHVLVAFDRSGGTFRTEQYADYKGGRDKMPSEFAEQWPYLKPLLDAFGIAHYDMERYEADDIIGTFAHMANSDDEVAIISGDKDLTQLADEHITVYITKKGVTDLEAYTPEFIREKFDLTPKQIIDLKGLMGDSSDNYPGITRVGEKSALKLLHQFGSLEAMYERLDELKPSKMKENIINDEAQARMSKALARILHDAPIDIHFDDIQNRGKQVDALSEFYRQMEFKTFLSKLQAEFNTTLEDDELTNTISSKAIHHVVETITDDMLPQHAVLYLETLEANYHESGIVSVAWLDAEQDGDHLYITTPEVALESDLFRNWLRDETVLKEVWNAKRDTVLLSHHDIILSGVVFDTSIAAYLVDIDRAKDFVLVADLIESIIPIQSDEVVYGKGAKVKIPENHQDLHHHMANKLHILKTAKPFLETKLTELAMRTLYDTIEMPLSKVLAKMEIRGVKVEEATLATMNDEVSRRLTDMEATIQNMAGVNFNINSPKQLGEVLFDVLGLPPIKKTKTGYSTAADVLEKLADSHAIIPEILDYRQLSKLQGTYLAGLPKHIQSDGKIHTRFDQILTQTGRLSSADPNLQNIPIRLEEGRKIRQAFVPSQEGWQLFGADYSQIELRVLAHICGDEHMRDAFIQDEDIHSATARRVFGLQQDEDVTSAHRRQAKAVNFGIVYGISDYGLSQNLNITRKEAQRFIDTYFEKYPGVAKFMQDIVAQAKKEGYVATLLNRRRQLPDLHASNFNVRSFAERTAMNSPIQGTAADIIKIAMVHLDEALEAEGLEARLLLQVHDELILEAPAHEIERLSQLVPEVMNHAIELSVPLKVDYNSGDNWYDLK